MTTTKLTAAETRKLRAALKAARSFAAAADAAYQDHRSSYGVTAGEIARIMARAADQADRAAEDIAAILEAEAGR